jgi:hypothetical protein
MIEESETLKVNVIASFLGLKFLPRVIALAFNNLNPKLILTNDDIEYRAFVFNRRLAYAEIESVDILLWIQTTNVYLVRNNSIFTVSANTNNEYELYRCLEYLKRKGCNLSERASEFHSRLKNKQLTHH